MAKVNPTEGNGDKCGQLFPQMEALWEISLIYQDNNNSGCIDSL